MYVELTAALQSLKLAKDMTTAVIDIRDARVLNAQIGKINGALLDAQSCIFAVNQERSVLVERISALEKEIAELKNWNADKQNYELREIRSGSPQAFAYAYKKLVDDVTPAHNLCANCYQNNKKSILQGETRVPGLDRVLVCHACDSIVYMSGGYRAQAK